MSIANPGPEPDGTDKTLADNTPDSARYAGDSRWPAGPGDPGADSTTAADETVKSPGDPAPAGTGPSQEPVKGPGPAQVPGD